MSTAPPAVQFPNDHNTQLPEHIQLTPTIPVKVPFKPPDIFQQLAEEIKLHVPLEGTLGKKYQESNKRVLHPGCSYCCNRPENPLIHIDWLGICVWCREESFSLCDYSPLVALNWLVERWNGSFSWFAFNNRIRTLYIYLLVENDLAEDVYVCFALMSSIQIRPTHILSFFRVNAPNQTKPIPMLTPSTCGLPSNIICRAVFLGPYENIITGCMKCQSQDASFVRVE